MRRIWSRKRGSETNVSDLRVQPGSTLKRDAYKVATAGFTGITAFGALAVTGAVAGTAAHQKAVQDAARPVPPPPPATQVVTKRRHHRTVVRTRVVHEVSARSVTGVGSGGTVRSSSGSSTWTGHSSGAGSGGGSGTASAPRPSAPKPAAPRPAAPAPAPSSGS